MTTSTQAQTDVNTYVVTNNVGAITAPVLANVLTDMINAAISPSFIYAVRDFGVVGDGVTDDTTAITNFWNHAIANPGVVHMLPPTGCLIKSAVPTINVNNVIIMGAGCDFHDTGAILSGSYLKWGGASGATVLTASAVSGGSNQRLSNVVLSGFGVDCNAGLAAIGLSLYSVRKCLIDVPVTNASLIGVRFDVVGSLGEARDCQLNNIRISARHYDGGGVTGVALYCTGDAQANFSLNDVWVECEHASASAVTLVNSDTNSWWRVRTNCPGTATEGISCLASTVSAARTCRNERFYFYSSNKPIHFYAGTYPSVDSYYELDTGNGTPVPVIDTGATAFTTVKSYTYNEVATAYTPTVTASSGSFGSAYAQGRYWNTGKLVYVEISITITTNGTAGGGGGSGASVRATLPFAAKGYTMLAGREVGVTGYMLQGITAVNSTVVDIYDYANLYPGANGKALIISGVYEAY